MKSLLLPLLLAVYCVAHSASAQDEPSIPPPLTAAIFDFDISIPELKGKGKDITALLNAQLSSNPQLILAERSEIEKALDEQALGISGTVDTTTAAKIGKITGVQLLVTGRVFPVQNDMVLVARIIGTETGRVLGEMVTMPARESLVTTVWQLGEKISLAIERKGRTLVAAPVSEEDVMVKLVEHVKGRKLPSVSIKIRESHLGSAALDPAVETEIGRSLQQLGFTILDPRTSTQLADVEITGEAFSELGLRKAGLVSVRGRAEAKAVQRLTGEVLWMDRQTEVAVDIGERIAGKSALERAAVKLLDRLVRRIVK